ncbi:MAG: Glycerate kinase [uncultured Nocardioidaceae bacterium]|uniref:Glycerate kinase n=1 Tax=uncultured Nocardioidaceae bacterium TaxID=253824 RepID=A0A6J4LM22_9ACTN|nr:MAG: Glycerate kinase [uncultured Nocardioidaceae bacterium]
MRPAARGTGAGRAMLATLAGHTDSGLARSQGAGAAGGMGFALFLLGARRQAGIELVTEIIGLPGRARRADLLVTGEGALDFSSRSGKVPHGVARVAAAALQPCIALDGQVLIGSREMRAVGIESAYSVVDLVGEDASFADPAGSLAALAERTARTWSR